MGEQSAKIKEVLLDEDFGDVAVKTHGARIEVHTDGSILAYTNGTVKVQPIANDVSSQPESMRGNPIESNIGDKLADGTVYAGISPDSGKAMHATPADAPLTMTFNEAADFAKRLNREKYLGQDDWRVPTNNELNVLFNNRSAVGGFNVSGSYPAGWYWSATPDDLWDAWCQRFSDGAQGTYKVSHSSVRLVR